MPQCAATARSTGEQCRKMALDGATVCIKHGAGAKQVRAAAAKRVAERKAAVKLGDYLAQHRDELAGKDPAQHLIEAITRTSAMVAMLSAMVDELAPRPGMDSEVGAMFGPDHNLDQKADIRLSLLGEWEDRLVKFSKTAIDAGVQERQVRIAEHAGRTLVEVLRGVLSDLGVGDHPDLAKVLGARLRAIETTGVEA